MMVYLVACVSFAKDKKGKGAYTQPTVTAEQAMAVAKDALSRLSVGSAIAKTGKRKNKKMEVPLMLDGNIVQQALPNLEVITVSVDKQGNWMVDLCHYSIKHCNSIFFN